MSYLEELLPDFRKGAKIKRKSWGEKDFVYYNKGVIYDKGNKTIPHLAFTSLVSDDWEIYQEPIDWDYIIQNKCLCWFWERSEKEKFAGLLTGVRSDGFFESAGYKWKHCRPVRRDEVTFYEDRKDEL